MNLRYSLLFVAVLNGSAVSWATQPCTLEHATYTANSVDGYPADGVFRENKFILQFHPSGGLLTYQAFELSGGNGWPKFNGEIGWPNGFSRPYANLSLVCGTLIGQETEEIKIDCGGDTWLWRNEIYALKPGPNGRVETEGFPAFSGPAPTTILLPNLGAALANQLKPFSFHLDFPDDVFWFHGCK